MAVEITTPRAPQKLAPKPRRFRLDVQALRALAVLMVVGVHLWPLRLPGGFAGVDVFFVISGYLITSHLYREIAATGRVRLGRFYARRIRRLLPAAFLVAIVSALGVMALMPYRTWGANLLELGASVGYVQNLYLTAQTVDYHALGQSTTVAQHYWSLSVEEQFYLLWPLFLMLLAWTLGKVSALRAERQKIVGGDGLAAQESTALVSAPPGVFAAESSGARARVFPSRALLAAGVALFGLGFFAFSLWFTFYSPNQAYFFTPVRFWEFAAGGLVALTAPAWARIRSGALKVALSLSGWIGLVTCAFILQPTWPFPGYWALWPVVCTALVIVAGEGRPVPGVRRLTDLWPCRFLGDISYSVYLWHWPLIVLAPYAVGSAQLGWKVKLVILALTLVAATLSKRLVEDPPQRWRVSTAKTFLGMLVAVALIVAFLQGGRVWAAYATAGGGQRLAQTLHSECGGVNALLKPECKAHVNDAVATVGLGDEANYSTPLPECQDIGTGDGMYLRECKFSERPGRKVMFVGDSHLEQWAWAIRAQAQRENWDLRLAVSYGCPLGALTAEHKLSAYVQPDQVANYSDKCWDNQERVDEWIDEFQPELVITSLNSNAELIQGSEPQSQLFETGLLYNWKRWLRTAKSLLVIEDVPLNWGARDLRCLEFNAAQPEKCAVPRKEVNKELLARAANAARSAGMNVSLLDFTGAFCDEQLCYAAVGGVPLYFDSTHVQRGVAQQLAGQIQEAIRRAMGE